MVVFVLVGLLLPSGPGFAWQSPQPNQTAGTSAIVLRRAYPRVTLGSGLEMKFDEQISGDGRFQSKIRKFVQPLKQDSVEHPAQPTPADARRAAFYAAKRENEIRSQVPPEFSKNPEERTVENIQPPERAVQTPKERSLMGKLAHSMVNYGYGGNQVLVSPESVTTDSQGRVIVTDPIACAVHVLARKAKDSFHIASGPGRRLRFPRSVAVDGSDNIYVSDSERGLVLVYDRTGNFVRSIGAYGEEKLLERPAGIAIDPATDRLIVADPPRHTVFIFDLKGRVVGRIEPKSNGLDAGSGSTGSEGLRFPQSVLVHHGQIVVLDSASIHIFDLQGIPLKTFPVSNGADWRGAAIPGLFMDSEDHLYLTDRANDIVREYDRDGRPVGAFGQPGIEEGEFNAPTGMWADSQGHVYIVDAHRIQIFRIERPK